MKVAFIGIGNMGASLAKAVAKEVASTDLLLVNRSPQKVEEFISQYGGTASNLEQVFQEAEVIFLGVKPYQICPLLEEYQDILGQRSNLLLVSMAAGLELEQIASVVKNERVGLIRIMPNTPVAIGQGVISLTRSQAVTDQQLAQIKQLLAGAGALYEIEEKLIDPATAVAGCGPAFVYQMIEAMADAGVALGLSREQALQMAAQTFQGASQMVLETGQHPGSLKPRWLNHRRSQSLRTSRLTGRHYCRCGSGLQTHARNGTRGRAKSDKIIGQNHACRTVTNCSFIQI